MDVSADVPTATDATLPSGTADVDVPSSADVPSRTVDTPSGFAETPAGTVDIPSGSADMPSATMDMPSASVDTPSIGGDMSGDLSPTNTSAFTKAPDADLSGDMPQGEEVDASMPPAEEGVEGVKASLDDLAAGVDAGETDDVVAKEPDRSSMEAPSSDAKKPKRGIFGGIFGSSTGKLEVSAARYDPFLKFSIPVLFL